MMVRMLANIYGDMEDCKIHAKFGSKEDYIEFAHEWVQVCGTLFPDSVNGKYKEKEAAMYEIYKAQEQETKFISNKFKGE